MTFVGLLPFIAGCNPEDCSSENSDNPDQKCDVSDTGQDGEQDGDTGGDDSPPAGNEPPTVGEDPVEPTPVEPPPSQTPTDPSVPLKSWITIANNIADFVDRINNSDKLSVQRTQELFSRGDTCHEDLSTSNRFADAIAFFVTELSSVQKVQLQGIASLYGMSSNDSSYYPVSLISHPLCRVTKSSLGQTIKKVPGTTTIAMAQKFADDHNRLRREYLDGSDQSREELQNLWGKFFGCLAYKESLSTSETSSSQRTASKYAPSGYRKPAGVKFYDDPAQNEASRLNIGLFQFTPNYSGNINPCFKQWNRDYPSCSLPKGNRSDIIRVVGSSLQHFNAYCGVHKLLQTFSVQVNSSKSRNTHPDNRPGGSFKNSSSRCVTPHFYAGWAYNHFGPLQNSTGSNLSKLLKCVYE
jgi:hypothetical protein